MKPAYFQWLLLIAGNAVMLVVITLFSLNVIVAVRDNRFDFYPRWQGAQAFWRGEMPYAPQVTEAIQRGMFGDILPPELDQQNFAYPAYTALILAPIVALPAPLAIAVWMALQFLAIPWVVIIWLMILNWKPAPWLLGVLVISFLFVFRYTMNLFVLAQFTGTMLLLISLAVWLLLRGQDVWAGILFALATIPPTIAAPLSVMILGGYLLLGRWKGLAAFEVTVAVLVGLSTLRVGWWVPDFINVLGQYAEYANPIWGPNLLPGVLAKGLFVIGTAALALCMLWRVWQKPEAVRQIDFILTSIVVILLLIPQTGNYYLVLLIPVLLTIIYYARSSTYQWLIWLGCVLTIISPWLYFQFSSDALSIETFLLPLQTLALWLLVNASRWLTPAAVANPLPSSGTVSMETEV